MNRKTLYQALLCAMLGSGASAVAADSIAEAVTGGDTGVALRYRLELVDDDNFAEDAEASTLRIRLNYRTADYNGWSAFGEFDHLTEVGLDDFNNAADTGPSRARFPVVADPDGSDLNQLYVQRSFGDKEWLRIGRQRILLDNQRFVGGVGWRQNEQTYDAASLSLKFAGADLFYSYVANVNRIFGNDVPQGDHDQETHLVNASWTLGGGKLVAYGYLIDNDDAPAFSTDTAGIRWSNSVTLGETGLTYLAEFAHQSDGGDNPVDYDANYYRLEGTAGFDPVSVGLGYEVLEGGDQPGAAFLTPLATLHAFNGWADRFLATPDAGIEDFFVTAGGKLGAFGWKVVWHDFDTEEGSADLGQELDASLSRKFGEDNRYGVLFKLAAFDGDEGPADVTKGWFMFTASF